MVQREPEYNNGVPVLKERVDNNLQVFACYLSTMDCKEKTIWVSSVSTAWEHQQGRLPTHSPNHFFFCSLLNRCLLTF